MIQQRKNIVQTRRDAWVEVNLNAIEHNINVLKKGIDAKTKILAVIKADAYGHGSAMTAPTLVASGVDMLGVATIDEGIELRNSGIDIPILVLGSTPEWAFNSAVENNIQLSIFSDEHIKACISTYKRTGKKPPVHIKVDTGMHRIGVGYTEAKSFIAKVKATPQIEIAGVFSHLACAETEEVTAMQQKLWLEVINEIENKNIIFHLANTAGCIAYKDLHYNMIRTGIGLYGLMPDLPASCKNKPDLKQALSLKGRVMYLKNVDSGCGISYGYSYVTDKKTKIATIPIGYADGIPRSLSNRIKGILNGHLVNQVGNITMDQMMFDVTNVENVRIGDIITLLGEDEGAVLKIDDWAKKLNTINYEITCRLKARLPRIYTRS